MKKKNEKDLFVRLSEWRASPATMVRELFGAEPDPWQERVLEAFPREPRIVLSGCIGAGRKCLLAWLAWNFLLTRPSAECVVTSAANYDSFWAELIKWRDKSPLLIGRFWTSGSSDSAGGRIVTKASLKHGSPEGGGLYLRRPHAYHFSFEEPPLRPRWDAFTGLTSDYRLYIVAQADNMDGRVLSPAEFGLAHCKEAHLIAAGRTPLYPSGMLYNLLTNRRGDWFIAAPTAGPDDPDRVGRVDVEWVKRWMEDNGESNPYINAYIFGRLPPEPERLKLY